MTTKKTFDKKKLMMNKLLDDLYGELTCDINKDSVIWSKCGNPVAGVFKENSRRLRLSKTNFKCFIKMFSLPWENPEDNKLLLEMILPYLKFDGGSPAIPILKCIGFIDEIVEIGLPSNWQ